MTKITCCLLGGIQASDMRVSSSARERQLLLRGQDTREREKAEIATINGQECARAVVKASERRGRQGELRAMDGRGRTRARALMAMIVGSGGKVSIISRIHPIRS